MEKIVDELSDYDARLDGLTDYIEDARFSLNMWNQFDTTGEKRRINNH